MTNVFNETRIILGDSFRQMTDLFLSLVPELLAAAIIIFIGWVIGKIFSRVARAILSKLGLDRWIKREGLSPALGGKNFSSIFAALIKWYIFAIFFIQSLGLIDNSFVQEFMTILNQYIHKVFGGIVILVLASLLAEHLRRAIKDTDIEYARLVGNIVKFLLLYFVFVLALQVMGVQANLLAEIFKLAFGAFAIAIAITAGVGFGLAFSEDARKIVKGVKKK